MASWLRVSRAYQIFTRQATARYYSETPYQAARNKWQLGGVPRPRSILEDDDAVIDLSEDNEAVNGAHPNTPPVHLRKPSGKATPHEYKAHRATMRKSFPEGWAPPRKLSREAMDALRQLHHVQPETFTTAVLADKFKISPEAVRRILKSKWEPTAEKRTQLAIRERRQRQAIIDARKEKEFSETQTVSQLQRMLRKDRFIRQKGGSDPHSEQTISDTLTFQ
ncbi:Required for respiratory growth protein 9, mitochondrial [Psilocybe cubensis]|uniref:Required for respiratory growth protein 9, mitochondrial n=2 Tax=Psilocybe cubensis TaxID=181762 RepID=A0ACB8GSF2_PSICU|nr:Required for respiratory growth protein 9, mitochondrial [Psilocybe cubensis]KAH9478668.1 Required for respiratory growth protein 9, mitochondrial [Psilocybe cubensis]